MKRTVLNLLVLLMMVGVAYSATADRWLHIKVDKTGEKAERVRVNIPLDLAEKILPAINQNNLQAGKIHIGEARMNDIDLRAVLDAIRTAKDNEFVTVDSDHGNVRVAKEGGNLVIRASGMRHAKPGKQDVKQQDVKKQDVNVTVPLAVIDALLSGGNGDLDLVGAIRALSAHGDAVLVTVTDGTSNVKIWVDSLSTAQ